MCINSKLNDKKLISVLKGNQIKEIPFWYMRQAGRHLPEYLEIKKKHKSFLQMCSIPETACEITLQPVKKYDMSAAILFADILLLPHGLDLNLRFGSGIGPLLDKYDIAKLEKIDMNNVHDKISYVYDTVSLLNKNLSDEKTLIGFAGAVWTVLAYMVEGGSSKDFSKAKSHLLKNKKEREFIFEFMTELTSQYLIKQIQAGAQTVQIFDSWAGLLPQDLFDDWVIEPTKKIVENIRKENKEIPIIGFPKGAGEKYIKYALETGVDCVSIDYSIPLEWVRDNLQDKVIVQGNLDPSYLVAGGEELKIQTDKILNILGEKSFIFNLGHGILPQTPVENVMWLSNYLKKYKR
jgi:uroporphyrinogen decarboxylase